MLHVCFTPYASCFVYTSWRFYAISGTNLLTRCHSASSLFSVVLCFRKATQEIFSELDKPKTETPIFPGRRTWTERELEGGQRAASQWGGAPPSWPRPGVVIPPGGPLTPPLRLFKASVSKTLKRSAFSHNSSAAPPPLKTNFRGQKSLFWHPAGTGKCP
jgi:hypothetical protein